MWSYHETEFFSWIGSFARAYRTHARLKGPTITYVAGVRVSPLSTKRGML